MPDMWQRIAKPDVLIYLDVGYDTVRQRREIDWEADWLAIETGRLVHAREHCDLYILTDHLTADEVAAQVLSFLTALPHPPSP